MNESEFDYRKYLQLIVKRKYLFVITALVIMTGALVYSYTQPEIYEAKCTVFIEKSVVSELVKGIAVTPTVEEKLRVLANTIKSRNLLLKVLDDLDLNIDRQSASRLEETVKGFQDQTAVRMKDNDGLFTIAFTSTSPRLARDYVNALVTRYIEDNTSSKREESYRASSFLGEQIASMREKLEQAEAKSNNFRRDNGGVLGQSEESVMRDISDMQERLDELAIKRRQIEGMISLNRKNDPLQTRLVALQRKLQDLSLIYTEQHPETMSVRNEIAAVKEQMRSGQGRELLASPSLEQEKLTMELNALRDSERNLRRQMAARQSVLRSIPAAKAGLDELEREKNSQKALYEQMVARHGQSEVSKQMEVQDKSTIFKIVDPAVIPTKPISQPRLRMILLGIVGGLCGSFALLLLCEQLDRSVKSLDALKSLGVPVLAVVPTINHPEELLARRRRDRLFFTVAGAYFLCLLTSIPLELLRDVVDVGSLKQGLMSLSK